VNRIVAAVALSVLVFLTEAQAESLYESAGAAGGSALTVRIYDYSELPGGYLRWAADTARHVYQQVGIETRWIPCRISLDEPEKNPDCESEPGPAVLQMRILPKVMAERFGLQGDVFGFALPPREGGFGNVASIFHHRVRKLADTSGTPAAVILGYMLAHEAGHLLLGISSHSAKGIMRVPWRTDDLRRAEAGGLKFTRGQAEQMRTQVAARSEAASEAAARTRPLGPSSL
jgi:hypothetical protein